MRHSGGFEIVDRAVEHLECIAECVRHARVKERLVDFRHPHTHRARGATARSAQGRDYRRWGWRWSSGAGNVGAGSRAEGGGGPLPALLKETAVCSNRRERYSRSLDRASPLNTMPTPATATEIAEAAGFDMSLIRESLALSYEQRILQHQAALDLMLEMERAGQRIRDAAASSPDSATQRR